MTDRIAERTLAELAAYAARTRPERPVEISAGELRALVAEVQEHRVKPSLSIRSGAHDEEARKHAATALGEIAKAIIEDRAVYEITCEPDADYELVQSWHTLDRPPTVILRTFGRIWRVKAHERR